MDMSGEDTTSFANELLKMAENVILCSGLYPAILCIDAPHYPWFAPAGFGRGIITPGSIMTNEMRNLTCVTFNITVFSALIAKEMDFV